MDEAFSSIDLVAQCLADEKRTLKFQEAIEKNVKKGDVVLDAGTGSSILALFAARAGARQVVAVECDPYVAELALKNIKNNGYENIIKLVVGDVRDINFEKGLNFDVVIMEMLTTGLVDEHQLYSVNNLHQKSLVKKTTKFIPQRQDTYVSLSEIDFEDYDFNMRMVKHYWDPFPVDKINIVSKPKLLNSINFEEITDLDFKTKIKLTAIKGGTVNSLYLTSNTILQDHIEVADTLSLNAPVAVPLLSDMEIMKDEEVELLIEYKFGGGFRNFTVTPKMG